MSSLRCILISFTFNAEIPEPVQRAECEAQQRRRSKKKLTDCYVIAEDSQNATRFSLPPSLSPYGAHTLRALLKITFRFHQRTFLRQNFLLLLKWFSVNKELVLFARFDGERKRLS